jgi:hypothetical protein
VVSAAKQTTPPDKLLNSAALRRTIERNTRFAQRKALLKEPVEIDPVQRNELFG